MDMENITMLSTLAVQHLGQSAILAALLFLGLLAFPSLSQEVRSWLWLSGFLLAILLPFAVFLPAQTGPQTIQGMIFESFAVIRNQVALPPARDSLLTLYQIGGGLWALGMLVQLVRFARSAGATRDLIKAARPLPDDFALSDVDIRADVPVYLSDQIASPIVTGFRRQIILLPDPLVRQLAPDTLNRILHHEYGHIQRQDIRIMMVQKILSAIFWWNPILHLMVAKLNQAREMACDERAVLSTGDPTGYARSLLTSAEQVILSRTAPLVVSISPSQKHLTQRIERLKTMNITSLKSSKMTSLIWSLTLVCLAATTAFLMTPRLATADQSVPAGEKYADILPISKFAPIYPKEAIAQKLDGYVIVKFDIAKDGTTTNVRVIKTSNEIFNDASLAAAGKFIYKPHPKGKIITGVLHKITFEMESNSTPKA